MPISPRPTTTPQRHRVALLVMLLIVLAVTAWASGCFKRRKYAPREVAKVLKVEKASLAPAIAARIAEADRPAWVTPDRWKRVSAIYKTYDNSPLWLEEEGVKDRAVALLEAIRHAPDEALDTAAYPLGAIEKVVDTKRITDTASAQTIADADVMLTSAYVAYASDMLMGQVDPRKVSQNWHTGSGVAERDSAVTHALEEGDMGEALKLMAPQDSGYAALKRAYARFRKAAAAGGWSPVSAGMSEPELLAAIHTRHLVEVDSGADSTHAYTLPDSADTTGEVHARTRARSPFADELIRYQLHHGLEPTGRLDKETITALNIPADVRMQQIAANMERHRWLPRSLGSRYVYVNVPAYRLDAYDGGKVVLSMKVVVGSEYQGRSTPTFSDSMELVVFRPYWNVTPEIQANEIGPRAASNPGWMESQNMEYYRDGGVTRIRQRPGGKNALGLVKFLFPNDFNIYLHDTPAKSLFARTDRAASHGCIRLEKPAELAEWVLGWDAARVQQAMHDGPDNRQVRLPRKIPVYIVYFTVYTRNGELYFGDDIYGRDDALMTQRAQAAD